MLGTTQKILMTCLLQAAVVNMHAEIGCMDDSKHRDIRDGYDYKTLHYVNCSCACRDHKNLNKKARCSKCLHYHHPADIYQF